MTDLRFEGESDSPVPVTFNFYPDHFYTELTIGLVLMILLSTPGDDPAGDSRPPGRPAHDAGGHQARVVLLRRVPLAQAVHTGTTAVLSLGFIVFVMFGWPFVDAWIRRRAGAADASVWIGITAVVALVGMTVWEAIAEH